MSMEVAGIMGGATGSNIMPRKNPGVINPMDKIPEIRRIFQQEIKYYDLCQKEKEGTLTDQEAKELKSIRITRALENLARIPDHTVCYMA